MIISYLIAPASAQQIFTPPTPTPAAPLLDDVDQQIVTAVREAGRIKTWSLLNHLSWDEDVRSRSAGQTARLNLLPRVQRLKRLKLIYGVGRNLVSTTKPVRQPARRRPGWHRPSVNDLPDIEGVSAGNLPPPTLKPDIKQADDLQLLLRWAAFYAVNENVEKTKSVPSKEEVRAAARMLSKLPRNPKRKLTGWSGGERCWRGQAILLPDSRRAFLWGCRRGRVIWSMDPDELLFSVIGAGSTWGVVPGSQVTLEKSSAATLLGQAKRGTKEARSAVKAAACRVNGQCPVHAGRRPRGRPRKLSA